MIDLQTGQRVKHPKWGLGFVKEVVSGGEDFLVVFDKGGPQGWAENSSHEPSELIPVEEK